MKMAISWQITTLCSNNCLHCFQKDEVTYEDELKNTLSLKKVPSQVAQ